MRGKKDLAAALLRRTGALALLERLPRRAQLIVVNHHRIGDAHRTRYDPSVFSATQDAFAAQLKMLAERYDLVTPSDALAIIEGRAPLSSTAVLLTFDDGYLDNLDAALPVLKAQGAEAVFFLATGFLDAPGHLTEWDAIGALVRRCVGREIVLSGPTPFRLAVREPTVDDAIARVLAHYRSPQVEVDRVIAELEACAGASIACAAPAAPMLMGWDDARRLREAGMTLGLHGHAHSMYSRLSEDEQRRDIATSLERFKARLGAAPDLLSYPFGGPASFNETTKRVAQALGLRAAFSFYGATNPAGAIDRYDVKRLMLVSNRGTGRMRAAMAALAAAGKHCF